MSFATARLMETWAHGQDIVDALGAHRTPTDRLRHIAYLGVRTREFSYRVKGLTPPGHSGVRRAHRAERRAVGVGRPARRRPDRGPGARLLPAGDATPARRGPDLQVTGDAAVEWMSLAQAFAGAPSITDEGRRGLSR